VNVVRAAFKAGFSPSRIARQFAGNTSASSKMVKPMDEERLYGLMVENTLASGGTAIESALSMSANQPTTQPRADRRPE
jgi:hypothetical protein